MSAEHPKAREILKDFRKPWSPDKPANFRGELKPTEPHPSAYEARVWIENKPIEELLKWREAFASCAIEGNRLGEVCAETLNRLISEKAVSGRYLLGLAWAMRSGSDQTEGTRQ